MLVIKVVPHVLLLHTLTVYMCTLTLCVGMFYNNMHVIGCFVGERLSPWQSLGIQCGDCRSSSLTLETVSC